MVWQSPNNSGRFVRAFVRFRYISPLTGGLPRQCAHWLAMTGNFGHSPTNTNSGYRVKTANHPAITCWDATVGAAISRPKPYGFQSIPFCRKRAMIEPFRAADSRPYGSNVRCFHGCCSKPIAYSLFCVGNGNRNGTAPLPMAQAVCSAAALPGRHFLLKHTRSRWKGFMATPHNSARKLSERFCASSKFQKRGNTVCISRF